VADRAAVTDTHPILFHAAGGSKLGKRAASLFNDCERKQAIIYVPMAVVWEVSLLSRSRRINLKRSVREFFDELFSNPAYQPLDLTSEQVFLADENRINDDPFDALIGAAALALELPLITRDSDITDSGLMKVIW